MAGDAVLIAVLFFFLFAGSGACLLFIIKAGLMDGTIDTGTTLVFVFSFLLIGGMIVASGSFAMIAVWAVITCTATFFLPHLGGGGRSTLRRLHEEDLAKYRRAIEFDPRNYSAHRDLADACARTKNYDEAIAEYKEALKFNPPDAKQIRRRLNETLDLQAGRVATTVICHACEAEVPPGKVCPHCGERLHMGFTEWIAQPENVQDILRGSIVPMLVAVVLITLFSAFSLEVKGVVLMTSVAVGGFYFLRGIGG